MLLSVQVTSILILTLIHAKAEAPPGYVKPAEEAEKNPPKYEYGYNIEDEKGTAHGKLEARDGIYALGRYYVQGVDSTHNVQYYADDWGFHPYIEYSNVGPHSKTRTQLLLGVEAVKALASNKFTSQSVAPKQHVTDTINSKLNNKESQPLQLQQRQNLQITVNQEPKQLVVEQPQVVIEQQTVQQPQVVVEQQQQTVQQPQVFIEQQHQVVPSVVVEQQHQIVQQPQVVIEQQHQQQQITVQQPQEVSIQQQQPQEVSVEQTQQIQQIQQSDLQSQQIQQSDLQSQQIASDDSDSIVVEARGRQSQQNLVQENSQSSAQQQYIQQNQPQIEQVLLRQEISHQTGENIQPRFGQPQLEQVQFGQEATHQFAQQQQVSQNIQQQSYEQLPQPQSLIQQNLVQDGGRQIQDNLIISQQSSQLESGAVIESARSSNEQILQQQQSQFGGFGSRLNLGRRRPTYNVQIQNNRDRLIETTRNLVSGQDVLNINGAIDGKVEGSIETSTARAITADNLIGVSTVTPSSLLNEPIVVADVDEKIISSTENYLNLQQQPREQIYSTTANTLETVSVKSFGVTEPSAVLVTPRPVSTDFLAPITAGIQLETADNRLHIQNAETSQNVATRVQLTNSEENQRFTSEVQKQNYVVEVQKSLPYYLGKFEYASSTAAPIVEASVRQSQTGNVQQKAVENIELGKTLLAFPESNAKQRDNLQIQQQLEQQQQQQIEQQQQQLEQQQQQLEQQQQQLEQQHQQLEQQQQQRQLEQQQQQQQLEQQQQQQQQISDIQFQQQFEEQLQAELRQQQNSNIQIQQEQRGNVQVQQRLQQQLPEQSIKENFIEVDQQQAQGIQHQVTVQQTGGQQTGGPIVIEKTITRQVPVALFQTKIVERPVEITKVVKQPYAVGVPVQVRVEVPVEVEKRVPVPVPVEKIVEKPVRVTELVEKRIHIPQPYPVEKIVEKPVHVPVEVTKYIDRPYPVQVPVAQPVPYPVDRVVEKIVKQPYPVHVKVPYEVKVPVPVEKIVERKVPVPQYIEKRVPVDRIVEKPVPHYIDRPYPVQVGVPVPVAQVYALNLPKQLQVAAVPSALTAPQLVESSSKYAPVKTISDYSQQPQQRGQQIQGLQGQQIQGLQGQLQGLQLQAQHLQSQLQGSQNLYSQSSTRSNEYLPPPPPPQSQETGGYLPPGHNCDQHNGLSSKNIYYTIQPDDYIGLSPPRLQELDQNPPRKFRNARSNFNSNLRLEYGFKPPLRPSQEIDEHGKPIIREQP